MKSKITFDLTAPFMICALFVILYVVYRIVLKKDMKIREKTVNLQAAGLAVFLFIIGKIADTLFKLIACREVDNDTTYHWYFAYEECYGMDLYSPLFGAFTICQISMWLQEPPGF